ncbi:uncharacterized protein LOC143444218 isoform X2 [Clavelina lepadiformis]|uniref:uncharacterized protein LOC143444218 isoform X2 n=1 Tax=Clavelina lepadiformis TaxID=159417 RepID=UPI004041DAAA
MNRDDAPNNSSQGRRRNLIVNKTSISDPQSKATSPARSPRFTRAGFQGTEVTSSKMKFGSGSPDMKRREIRSRFRSESPIIGASGEVIIEGEDEFNQTCNSIENLSRNNPEKTNPGRSKFVEAFSKPLSDSKSDDGMSSSTLIVDRKNSNQNFDSTANKDVKSVDKAQIDRAGDHIAPNYVSSFSKVGGRRIADSNETSEDKTMSRRRERVAGGRTKHMQPQQEQNGQRLEENKIASHYLPAYIQPVVSNVPRVVKNSDADVIFNSHNSYRRQNSRTVHSQMSSSTSGDSGNEAPNQVQRLRVAFNEGKLTPDTSDNEPETHTGRRRRPRPRNRTAGRSSHTPDYLLTNRSKNTESTFNTRTLAGSKPINSAPQGTGRRSKNRKQYFVETDDKYNTLPADFRAIDTQNVSVYDTREKVFTSNSSHQNKFRRGLTQDDSPNLSQLMISGAQTSVALEGSAKEEDATHRNRSNQSQDFKQSSAKPDDQCNVPVRKEANRAAIAPGCNATLDKSSHTFTQSKPNQIGQIKSLFNTAEVPKTEFGVTYSSKQQQERRAPVLRLTTPEKPRHETEVVLSQPMLKVKKLSEDFWPRDEATQKLLNRGSNPMHYDSSQITENGLEMLNNMSDVPPSQEQTMHVANGQQGASGSDLGQLRSSKQTNLNGPSCEDSRAKTNNVDSIPYLNSHESESVKNEKRKSGQRSQTKTLESRKDAVTSPTSKWSFDDPDEKLKAFDTLANANENNNEADSSVIIKNRRTSNSNVISEVDRKKFPSSVHNATITNTNHVVPTYNGNDYVDETPVQTPTNEYDAQSNTTIESVFSSDQVVSQTGMLGGSNMSSTISTSTRKTSVVSQSTALRRNKSLSSLKDPSNESADIDEGCFVEDEIFNKNSPFEQDFNETSQNDNRTGTATQNSRRRRKFSAAEQTSDSSDTSGETLSSARSLSDLTPSHKKSMTDKVSMTVEYKTGHTSADDTCSGINSASDLSTFSENTSMQDDFGKQVEKIIGDTSKIDEALASFDAKNISKTLKKKSYSDPNANAVMMAGGLMGKKSNEIDLNNLYNSSSEPALSEQLDELGELIPFRNPINSHIKSARTKTTKTQGIGALTESIQEMSKSLLMDTTMSPRTVRKNASMKARKRAENAKVVIVDKVISPPTMFDNPVEQEEEQFKRICEEMANSEKVPVGPVAHARSCSEPAVVDTKDSNMLARKLSGRGRRAGIVEAPPLTMMMNDKNNNSNLKTSKYGGSVDRISSTLPRAAGNHRLDYQAYIRRDKLDMRKHVVTNLLEAEDSYVKSLRILYENYLKPLKRPDNHSICEPRLVDIIFLQIPEILQHHEKFYENVRECFENWDPDLVKMGDIFRQSFNKDMLLESYTSYIKNFSNARQAVNFAIENKSAFKVFLEDKKRENKDKLGLSDLLIQPVQRISRYELIIKDLLKHTHEGHPDHPSLLVAQKEIHALSVQMNKVEKDAEAADRHLKLLQEIEQMIEGCLDISSPSIRKFLHQDFCIELKSGNKKDRSLWLFNDLLMCTTSKKGKSSSLRRSSMNIFAMTNDRVVVDYSSKYKFLWKYQLEDVELLKGSTGPNHQAVEKQLQQLRADQDLLLQMEESTAKLGCIHNVLDDALKELIIQTGQRITERQQQINTHGLSLPGRLEIGITTPDGMKLFQFEFPSEENKSQFEIFFWNAKKNFTSQRGRLVPAFMKAIPISKTRNGMQFSCAASNVDTSPGTREVWVCNTDGYVGQICFLTLEPEPSQTTCISVCNSKICCIAQVPTWDRRFVPTSKFINDVTSAPLENRADRRRSSSNSNRALTIMPFDSDESDEDNTSPFSTISNYSISPYSTNNSASNFASDSTCVNESRDTGCDSWGIDSSDISTPTAVSGSTNDLGPNNRGPQNSFMHALSAAWKKDSDGSTLHGSLEDLLTDKKSPDGGREDKIGKNNHATSKHLSNNGSMWLGTEDGKIKVYPTSEAFRGTKHCAQLNHSASVQCILHHQGQVFVALSNGDLVIYSRNMANGQWEFDNKKTKTLGTSPHPITKMVVVGDKELWCGCQNQIMILDTSYNSKSHSQTYNVKSFFPVSQDNKRQIYCMVCCGYGVWVALDKRAQIKLYHTVTHDLLTDIDVSQPVSKMLASSDAIIRQHKAACLRITSLLVCKDLLWVGTSAGVVLTLALPNITQTTNSLSLPIIPQGLAYGHTGHVRFLTSVETVEKDPQMPRGGRRLSSSKRRLSSASATNQTKTLVISGGDGYEDFRMNAASEAAGREDSTNHLLLWRV